MSTTKRTTRSRMNLDSASVSSTTVSVTLTPARWGESAAPTTAAPTSTSRQSSPSPSAAGPNVSESLPPRMRLKEKKKPFAEFRVIREPPATVPVPPRTADDRLLKPIPSPPWKSDSFYSRPSASSHEETRVRHNPSSHARLSLSSNHHHPYQPQHRQREYYRDAGPSYATRTVSRGSSDDDSEHGRLAPNYAYYPPRTTRRASGSGMGASTNRPRLAPSTSSPELDNDKEQKDKGKRRAEYDIPPISASTSTGTGTGPPSPSIANGSYPASPSPPPLPPRHSGSYPPPSPSWHPSPPSPPHASSSLPPPSSSSHMRMQYRAPSPRHYRSHYAYSPEPQNDERGSQRDIYDVLGRNRNGERFGALRTESMAQMQQQQRREQQRREQQHQPPQQQQYFMVDEAPHRSQPQYHRLQPQQSHPHPQQQPAVTAALPPPPPPPQQQYTHQLHPQHFQQRDTSQQQTQAENSQLPLHTRQHPSHMPLHHVGGAQFVLKPPRVPKPRVSRATAAAARAAALRPLAARRAAAAANGEGGSASASEDATPETGVIDTLSGLGTAHGTTSLNDRARARALAGGGNEQGGSETNTFPAPGRPSRKVKRYPCDICGQIFTRSGDVRRHKESRHTDGTGGCRCPYCDRVLTRQDALQRHWDKYCRKKSKRHVTRNGAASPSASAGGNANSTADAEMDDDEMGSDSARGEDQAEGDDALGGSSGVAVGMGMNMRFISSGVSGRIYGGRNDKVSFDDDDDEEEDEMEDEDEDDAMDGVSTTRASASRMQGVMSTSTSGSSGAGVGPAPPAPRSHEEAQRLIFAAHGIQNVPGSYTTHPHPGPQHRAPRVKGKGMDYALEYSREFEKDRQGRKGR